MMTLLVFIEKLCFELLQECHVLVVQVYFGSNTYVR
jgi:hypothetical protein